MPADAELKLPEGCAVRLVDLEPGVGGVLAVDETGFVNIYLNARLSREGQARALRHELRHYYREDLYSDVDIREVERLAELPDAVPVGRVAGDLDALRGPLLAACRLYDAVQTPPLVSVRRLETLARALGPGDIDRIARGRPSVALRFRHEAEDRLRGALFYDAAGQPDNALAVFEADGLAITVDLRRRRGSMDVYAIARETPDGRYQRIY